MGSQTTMPPGMSFDMAGTALNTALTVRFVSREKTDNCLDASKARKPMQVDPSKEDRCTRLRFFRADGQSAGRVEIGHLVKIFSEDQKICLDIGTNGGCRSTGSHHSASTCFLVKPLDGSLDVMYGELLGIYGTDGRRLDIQCCVNSYAHRSWATQLQIHAADMHRVNGGASAMQSDLNQIQASYAPAPPPPAPPAPVPTYQQPAQTQQVYQQPTQPQQVYQQPTQVYQQPTQVYQQPRQVYQQPQQVYQQPQQVYQQPVQTQSWQPAQTQVVYQQPTQVAYQQPMYQQQYMGI